MAMTAIAGGRLHPISSSQPFEKTENIHKQEMYYFSSNVDKNGAVEANEAVSSKQERQQRISKSNKANGGKRKSVSFNRTVQVRTTIHVDDYSDDEIDACWFCQEEYDRILLDIAKTLEYYDKNGPRRNDEYCFRGLEAETSLEYKQVCRERFIHGYMAVFEEQGLQWEEGIHEAECVAFVYKKAARTSSALVEAQELAAKDAREAVWEQRTAISVLSSSTYSKKFDKRGEFNKTNSSYSSNISSYSNNSWRMNRTLPTTPWAGKRV